MSVLEVPRVFVPQSDKTDSVIEDHLRRFLEGGAKGDVRLSVAGVDFVLSSVVAEAVVTLSAAMAEGVAVGLSPVEEWLSTGQAAELLGVSRPTLVKMLDAGRIPSRRLNSHRRVARSALLEYIRQLEEYEAASRALDRAMNGDGPEDVVRMVREARQELWVAQ